MDLKERVADLVVKYLFHECRTYNGLLDQKKQAEFIVQVANIFDIARLFKQVELASRWKENHYEKTLQQLFENRDPDEWKELDANRTALLTTILTETLKRTNEEAEERKNAYEEQKLRKRIIDLEAQIEFGKPLEKVGFWDRLTSRVNLPYFIVLLLAITLIAGLSVIGMTATMTVNVDFSIGEIIGGLLVGTGIAAAGISYAANNGLRAPDHEPR